VGAERLAERELDFHSGLDLQLVAQRSAGLPDSVQSMK
jgi:hypothetical protein